MGGIIIKYLKILPGFVLLALGGGACGSQKVGGTEAWNQIVQSLESPTIAKKSIQLPSASKKIGKKLVLPSNSKHLTKSMSGTDSLVSSKMEAPPADRYAFSNPNPEPYIPYRIPSSPQVLSAPAGGGLVGPPTAISPGAARPPATANTGQVISSGGGIVAKGLQGSGASAQGTQGSTSTSTGAGAPAASSASSTADAKVLAPGGSTATIPTSANSTGGESTTNPPDQGEPSEAEDGAAKTTIAKLTNETPPNQPALSPEGTVGSSPQSVVLPSFDTHFISLAGGPSKFNEISPRTLDYVVWFLTSDSKPYEKIATFRYYNYKVFEGTQIPINPDCKQEALENGQIKLSCQNAFNQSSKVFEAGMPIPPHTDCEQESIEQGRVKLTCQGPFPFVNGHMLRLVTCGNPNMDLIRSTMGNTEHALEEFVDRAWVRGDKSLWNLEACGKRTYVDYVFKGPDLQLVFPLEMGSLYLLVQLPKDYMEPEKHLAYGIPMPNHLGIHNTQYASNALMGNFLLNGRIVQAIFALPLNWMQGYRPGVVQEYLNYPYTAPPSGKGGINFEGMPANEVCQELENWDPASVQMEADLFQAVNQTRAQGADCGSKGNYGPTTPLDVSPTLRCAARYHSRDMDERGYFSHIDPDGSSDWLRIFVAGFLPVAPGGIEGEPFSQTGENIASGPVGPQKAIEGWLTSDEHCANLMNPMFTHAGVGYDSGKASGPLWTLNFGRVW